MTRDVHIYQPTKTAMQSGRGNTEVWRIDIQPERAKRPEPLMGWSGGGDTTQQLKLTFDSRDEAIAYAQRQGWHYTIEAPAERTLKAKSYADNFRYDRIRS